MTRAAASTRHRTPSPGQFRSAAFGFAGLFGLAVFGFWKPYFARVSQGIDPYTHAHAILMSLWCLLLIAQAWLVRTGKNRLHRRLGASSYALVPLIAISTPLLAHHRLKSAFTPDQVALLFVQLGTLAIFAGGWVLAMLARRRRALHARFVIGSSLTMIDPVMARVALFSFPELVPLTEHVVPGVTIPLLLALAVRDRGRAVGAERLIFPISAIVFAAYQIGVWLVPPTALWRSFAAWFVRLPLT